MPIKHSIYLGQTTILEQATKLGATHLTIDMDSGAREYPIAEALELWELLAPGEGFRILAMRFAEHEHHQARPLHVDAGEIRAALDDYYRAREGDSGDAEIAAASRLADILEGVHGPGARA